MISGVLCILIGLIGLVVTWFLLRDKVCNIYKSPCTANNEQLVLTATGKVMVIFSCIMLVIGGVLVFKPRLDLLNNV